MAEILRLPGVATKLGCRRVKRRAAAADPNQLDLFPPARAQIISFSPEQTGPFEQALLSDEQGEARAAELYQQAIEKKDCVADALCNLGILESRNGNSLKAFDCFTTSLKHNPRHVEAHYNLANLYFDLNDFRLAQVHFEMTVEVDPGFANAHFNLALVHLINSDPAKAVRAFTRYEELVSPAEAQTARALLEEARRSLPAARSGPGESTA